MFRKKKREGTKCEILKAKLNECFKDLDSIEDATVKKIME